MAEPEDDPTSIDPLLVWGLSSFHAALFVALVVTGLYVVGVVDDQLAAVGTELGVLAYLYLWAATWWTNRRWLESIGPGLLAGSASQQTMLAGAIMWGGITGLIVFVPSFAVGGAVFIGAGGFEALTFLIFGAAIGAALAAGAGALVGSVFALVDLFVLWAARAWLVDAGAAAEPPTD